MERAVSRFFLKKSRITRVEMRERSETKGSLVSRFIQHHHTQEDKGPEKSGMGLNERLPASGGRARL